METQSGNGNACCAEWRSQDPATRFYKVEIFLHGPVPVAPVFLLFSRGCDAHATELHARDPRERRLRARRAGAAARRRAEGTRRYIASGDVGPSWFLRDPRRGLHGWSKDGAPEEIAGYPRASTGYNFVVRREQGSPRKEGGPRGEAVPLGLRIGAEDCAGNPSVPSAPLARCYVAVLRGDYFIIRDGLATVIVCILNISKIAFLGNCSVNGNTWNIIPG